MSRETDHKTRETDADLRGEDTVARLLELAGPRADIPADLERRVHDSVRQEWRTATSMTRSIRWAIPLALAATMLVAIALGFRTPDMLLQPLGTIVIVADISADDGLPLAAGNAVYAGDNLDTSTNNGMSVLLNGDISLRIAAGTSVRLDAADEITLLSGQVYADSGDRIYRDRHITVHTDSGSATDIGTQFSVLYENGQTRVAVREGRVDVAADQSSLTALAGDRLTWQADGDVVIDQVTTYDPSWRWATSLAPAFDIENRSLLDILKWASRETGKTLKFSNNDVRMAAMRTMLHGSVSDLTPLEAIESVLLTTQFQHHIDEQSITITK